MLQVPVAGVTGEQFSSLSNLLVQNTLAVSCDLDVNFDPIYPLQIVPQCADQTVKVFTQNHQNLSLICTNVSQYMYNKVKYILNDKVHNQLIN